MATDPNKKTLRHFQCRDYLWETFEQMSAELECSVDYLINEAMRQYARSRSYSRSTPGQATGSVSLPPPGRESRDSGPPTIPPASPSQPAMHATPAPSPARTTAPPAQQRPLGGPPGARPNAIPTMPSNAGGAMPRIPSLPGMPATNPRPGGPGAGPAVPAAGPRTAAPQLPPLGRGPVVPPLGQRPAPQGAPPPYPAAPAAPFNSPRPQQAPAGGPPPMPRGGAAMTPAPEPPPAAAPQGAPTLYALYQGQRYAVDKEEFVIGRGQKSSDLVIRDSNVSRRHAVVVLHNGQFWMVDQQSTNGVEFMGAKIDRKRIDEGDVFKICDYEVVFTYR